MKAIINQAPEEDIKKSQHPENKTLQDKIRKNNYFTCELMFEIEKGSSSEYSILNIPIVSLDSFNSYYYTQKCLVINGQLTTVNLHFTKSSYCSSQSHAVICNIKKLHEDFSAMAKSKNDRFALMSANALETIQGRQRPYNFKSNPEPSYVFLNTDSEAYMLAYLQIKKVQSELIQKLKTEIVDKGLKVKRIIFNGCTTRAMCGLCGMNMNILQYLANEQDYKQTPMHFLGIIKKFLINTKSASDTCPITTYISSLQKDSAWFEIQAQVPREQCVNIFCLQ